MAHQHNRSWKGMTAIQMQNAAMAYLAKIGAPVGQWLPFEPGRPTRTRGRRRKGQHRGHHNPMTRANSKNKA